METKISHSLIKIMIGATLYVAIQSVIWVIKANFPLSAILYVVAIMIIILALVILLAKRLW